MKRIFSVVAVMLCILAFCIAPVAAGNFSTARDDGITISPLLDPFFQQTRGSITGNVTQGQTKIYNYLVDENSTIMGVKVEWDDPSNNLGLLITTPRGVTYGEFDDYFDLSVANGIIPLTIQAGTTLPVGIWKFKINGKSVSGVQIFNLTVNHA